MGFLWWFTGAGKKDDGPSDDDDDGGGGGVKKNVRKREWSEEESGERKGTCSVHSSSSMDEEGGKEVFSKRRKNATRRHAVRVGKRSPHKVTGRDTRKRGLLAGRGGRGRGGATRKKNNRNNGKEEEEKEKERAAKGDEAEAKKAARRVRSLWKVRPLPVDEKIKVFFEGREDGCGAYDDGQFLRWQKDCDAGKADPMEAGAYPLVIQDSDLRPLLEIKYPTTRALQSLGGKSDVDPTTTKVDQKRKQSLGIHVPTFHRLAPKDWPEKMLQRELIHIVHRTPDGKAESITGGKKFKSSGANKSKSAVKGESEDSYFRYMQPTPDDLDQSIEYDLDDEDELWLVKYNKRRKKSSALGEEWMEHLMDKMEKEYTSELQKHPEKWILKQEDDSSDLEDVDDTYSNKEGKKGLQGTAPPPLILPSISEMFPLSKCLKVSGLYDCDKVIKDVYKYWKDKHERAGRPLIQRLWYEPPWHRKATATTPGIDGEDVFAGYDVPSTLSRIRKRNMDYMEVQNRFDSIRRDLEMARTLADLVRRREKLKRQEALLLKEEWTSRMKGV